MRELWLVGTQQGYPIERILQKSKMSTVDIEIKRTGLRVSYTGVSSTEVFIYLIFVCFSPTGSMIWYHNSMVLDHDNNTFFRSKAQTSSTFYS